MNKILCIIIVAMFFSCGIRKTDTAISKDKIKSTSDKESVSKVNESQLTELNSKILTDFDIYRSDTRYVYTKYYDTTGRVSKETYEDVKTESKDNTKMTTESSLHEKSTKNNYFKIRERETVTINHFTKQKKTERDNSLPGLVWFIGGMILMYFLAKKY